MKKIALAALMTALSLQLISLEPIGAMALFSMKKKETKQRAFHKQIFQVKEKNLVSLEATLTANKSTAELNEEVTFYASATGGTPPYTYYWWFDGDTAWTPIAENQYTRGVTRLYKQNMYLVVKDSQNNVTKEIVFKVNVKAPAELPAPGLPASAPPATGGSASR